MVHKKKHFAAPSLRKLTKLGNAGSEPLQKVSQAPIKPERPHTQKPESPGAVKRGAKEAGNPHLFRGPKIKKTLKPRPIPGAKAPRSSTETTKNFPGPKSLKLPGKDSALKPKKKGYSSDLSY